MEEGEVFYFNKSKNAVQYRINSSEDLKLVINHFDSYPLCTQKKADYLLFKSALEIINNKKSKFPLTLEYLTRLIEIKGALNWGLSDVLKKAFPDIAPVLRPEFELPRQISSMWGPALDL